MIIEYRKPSAALAPFVDHLWEKQVEDTGIIPYDIETIFPEDQTVLTYSLGKEYYRSHANTDLFQAINGIQLEGLHQAPNFYKHQPGIHIFGVKFRVGGLFAFLPSPISATNNESSAADTLLPDLPSLRLTNNFDERCETIEAYLLAHLIEKQAKKYLKLCQDFAKEVVFQAEDKKEEVLFMNRAINHFAKNDEFEETAFLNEVMQNPEFIPEFKNYKVDKGAKYSIEDVSNFPIANAAVTDARKKMKNTIQLDTNIQIKLDFINPESAEKFVEKGWDEEKQMYYYLVYFNKEQKS